MAETPETLDAARALPEALPVEQLADVFRLMGDHSRLRLLLALRAGPHAVGALASATGLSPSLVSHHLRLLRAGRLVRAERRGKQVFYTIDDAHIGCVLDDMVEHLSEFLPAPPRSLEAAI
ncbi:MAG TPA: metalloregulator ArsR/SmtB family transcription factor [Kiloniellales bacterium]|nr:metalloregulator ArsR/SmtB family transcription factor [Kiloniellales bacterium]